MVLYEMLTGLPPWYSYDQTAVVNGILRGKLTFPDYVSDVAKSFISGLLVRNPEERLGSGGTDEILRHPFFAKIDWEAFRSGTQPVPFVPPCEESSVSNFDQSFTSLPLDFEVKPSRPEVDAFESFSFSHEAIPKSVAGYDSLGTEDINADDTLRF